MTDPLTLSLPQRIWLQVNPEGDPEDRSQPVSEANWGDLTWCYDSIGGQEVAYVREDLADGFLLLGLLADIRAAAGDSEGRLMQPELVEHIRKLKAQADEADALRGRIAELERDRDQWKANHDNQAALKAALLDRPDLKDRATLVQSMAADRERLRAENEALRADLQQRINDEADIHYSGEEQARSGVHELFTGLDDCEIEVPDEWHEKPLLRFIFETDPGDDSVGMPSRSAWSLAKDQSGTVLLDLLSQLLTHEAAVYDAERYRWIRNQALVEIGNKKVGGYTITLRGWDLTVLIPWHIQPDSDHLGNFRLTDTAIDAARAAREG
jgi:hypothetical protein